MSLKHKFVSPVADGAETDKVQPQRDWNAPHVFSVLTADPASPTGGDLWLVGTGATPTRLLELKFCDPLDGAIVTLFSVTR